MGLTIHYGLIHADAPASNVRPIVEQLRQHALRLPFQEVGPLVELSGDACDFERCEQDDPNRWLLIQAREYLDRHGVRYAVLPTALIAFTTQPGKGCEPANFGLCQYPRSITVENAALPKRRPKSLRTGIAGWRWGSFCKTQYASNSACGGVENFLRCHLSIVSVLDRARELGVLGEVCDEGGFWDKRDVSQLARQVGQWNQMIAAQVGQLMDLLNRPTASGTTATVHAEIRKYPDFEHLEAGGKK